MVGILNNRNFVVMTIVLFLISACATSPTAQPVPTFTNQQLADNAVATAQAEHIAMCNDQAVNHANEVVAQAWPELMVSNVHYKEKWAILRLSFNQVPSECGNDYEIRAYYPEIGTEFYPDHPDGTELLSKAVFRFVFNDGSSRDFQFVAANNFLIATIKNFAGASQLVSIQVIYTIENGFSGTPKMDVTVTNATVGQFAEDVRLEYMTFGDWWVTPSVTPGGYTLDPDTTPLPVYPSPTAKFPWLDFLNTDTPMPPSPTASYTPAP